MCSDGTRWQRLSSALAPARGGGWAEPGDEGQRAAQGMVARSSEVNLRLTLMVFFWNVHPLVFIDHLKRVQNNPSENRLGKIQGRMEL